MLNDLLIIPERVNGRKGVVFGKVEHAPIGMMACPNQDKLNSMKDDILQNDTLMQGFCHERYFDRLPGYIDVSILSTIEIDENGEEKVVLLEEPEYMAIPLCEL